VAHLFWDQNARVVAEKESGGGVEVHICSRSTSSDPRSIKLNREGVAAEKHARMIDVILKSRQHVGWLVRYSTYPQTYIVIPRLLKNKRRRKTSRYF
jgi:hypothetical protein